jgi:hypothetical protein
MSNLEELIYDFQPCSNCPDPEAAIESVDAHSRTIALASIRGFIKPSQPAIDRRSLAIKSMLVRTKLIDCQNKGCIDSCPIAQGYTTTPPPITVSPS